MKTGLEVSFIITGWIVKEYNFDAVRIDTVKHVRKEFWRAFSDASGVFSIGEILRN